MKEKPPFTVRVLGDDNYHYMDPEARYVLGEFQTCAAAIAACKEVVDKYLLSACTPGMSAEDLWQSYVTFGPDPFIAKGNHECRFSAWDYARERCEEICRPRAKPRMI